MIESVCLLGIAAFGWLLARDSFALYDRGYQQGVKDANAALREYAQQNKGG